MGEGFCQLRTVGIDVARRAVHFHQSRQDLCVQAVVLRAQKAHAAEDGGRLLLLNNAGIALLPDGIGQLRQEERPCKHTVHSGGGQRTVVRLRVSVIGAKDKGRLPGHPAQSVRKGGQLLAAAAGQEDDIRFFLPQQRHRFVHAVRRKHGKPGFPCHGPYIIRKLGIVCEQKNTGGIHMICGIAVDGEGERHLEAAAPAGLALHGDPAAHQVDDVFRDGHAQAGALHLVGGGAFRPGEGVEDMGQEFLGHAIAAVGDDDAERGVLCIDAGKLGDVKADRAAVGRVFHGVGQQIDQDLPQAHAVADQEFVGHIVGADQKILCLFRRPGTDDAVDLADLLGKAHRLADDADLSRLDLAHIQHVVDQGQHMLAGGVGLADIAAHFVRQVLLVFHQAGNAQDGVHGRADVVGHVGEELAFGTVGGLGLLGGGFRQPYRGGQLRVFLIQLTVDGGQLVVVFPFDGQGTLLACCQDEGDGDGAGNDQQDGKGKDHPCRGVHQQNDVLGHIV